MQDFTRVCFLKTYIEMYRVRRSLVDIAPPNELDDFGRAIIDLTRTIYASTPSSQRKLRDIVVRTIQRNIELGDITKRSLSMPAVSALIAENPDLAHDLATRRLSTSKWPCAVCGHKKTVLLAFCSEGNWDCRNYACEKETDLRNHCGYCLKFDILQRPI